MHHFSIGARPIGPGRPCFVIAEAGVNHNGDLDTACRLVDAAKEAGADAVKFQTFRADALVTPKAPKAPYQLETSAPGQSQHAMLRGLELSPAFHEALIDRCRRQDIVFLSTPFDEQSADLLVDLGVTALKIPSGEITNLPFLRHVAAKKLPVLLSTGMAFLGEVERALEEMAGTGPAGTALLHCLSSYPAPPGQANLRAMATMRAAFGLPVGYSDHTPGLEVALAAVALGADILEKHFTLDRTMPGPDHRASLEPAELAALVRGVRVVEASLGDGRKRRQPCEEDVARVARKSITTKVAIAKGGVIASEALAMRRPGTGLAPELAPLLIGRKAARDIEADALLRLEDIVAP
jgi:N-acetylneuraminate synthase